MQLIARRDAVRSANLARLRAMGFSPVGWLPLREHRALVRPNEEIARRAVALAAAAMWITSSEAVAPSAEILAHVSRGGLRSAAGTAADRGRVSAPSGGPDAGLDADEAALLDAPRASAAQDDPIWDAVVMLGWALGLEYEPTADGAPLEDRARDEARRWLYRGGDVHPSMLTARVRSADEIVPLEDLFTCAHQSSRLVQLGFVPPDGTPMRAPRRADHLRIEVRRQALTWILSPGAGWQEVDLGS